MLMRRSGLRSLLLLCTVAACAAPASAANWDRFRGPNGTGTASDKDIPVQWSAKENILWKVPLPGPGNASPIIWGNRLFLQCASADGKQRQLVCMNASDGKVLWTRSAPGSTAHTHQKNTLASSTPATDGERVYVLFWDGTDVAVHAYDFEGNPHWQQGLGAFKSQHGAGTSPVVHAGKVFVANDQDGTSTLFALDAKTGEIAWKAARKPFRACYSTPFILEQPEKAPQLIVASTAGVTSYDPPTGKVNWNWNWTTFANMALRTVGSPVYSQGLIFTQSGDGGGARHLVAVRAEGQGDVTATNLAWEWKKTRPFPYVPTMLPLGDHLYFVNDRGDAGCVVARTGELLWEKPLGTKWITASPVLIDGKVYAIGEEGTVFVFKATPQQFELLAKNDMGEEVRATPAVANGRLYIRGKDHLFCIGKPRDVRTQR